MLGGGNSQQGGGKLNTWSKITSGPNVLFPQVHLASNPPNKKKNILFLNKNTSLLREWYVNVNT